jgi:hypothetical protein
MFFDRLVVNKEKGRDFRFLLVDSLDSAVSVAMAPWTLEIECLSLKLILKQRP